MRTLNHISKSAHENCVRKKESPVGNSTNCTVIEGKISVQVTDQNTELESNNKTNNQRFVNKSSAEIEDIITRAETKNTLSEFWKVSFTLENVTSLLLKCGVNNTNIVTHTATFSCDNKQTNESKIR